MADADAGTSPAAAANGAAEATPMDTEAAPSKPEVTGPTFLPLDLLLNIKPWGSKTLNPSKHAQSLSDRELGSLAGVCASVLNFKNCISSNANSCNSSTCYGYKLRVCAHRDL